VQFEVVAMSVWHRDIPQILVILTVSNAAALGGSLRGRARQPAY
jgi:hypothetical protein